MFSSLGSLTYGNESGNISLNLILPTVVTKYLSFLSSVNNLCLNELTGIAILVCNVISRLSYAIKASLAFLNNLPSPCSPAFSIVI